MICFTGKKNAMKHKYGCMYDGRLHRTIAPSDPQCYPSVSNPSVPSPRVRNRSAKMIGIPVLCHRRQALLVRCQHVSCGDEIFQLSCRRLQREPNVPHVGRDSAE